MRSRSAREPAALEQIPVWYRDEPPHAVEAGAEVASAADALLAGLNVEQAKAVTHGEGPLLVVAGAGTGKTQVITRRIAWLIATRRARPSEILALTFTDKAADEMQVRVDQLVPYGFTDTAISTFHAFGDRIIREYALELGLPPDARVLSRPETVIFLRERLFDFELQQYRPLGDPTRFLDALATFFSRCKDEEIGPQPLAAFAAAEVARAAAATDAADSDEARAAAAARVEEAGRLLELAGAYGTYQELLARAGFLDFGDQVTVALRLLRESPAAREAIRRRFRYILVDEFQDTNRAQGELVALLAESHRNVTVVGDDDQSIYRFRGAAIGNIIEFLERYRGARRVILRRNYRSLEPILVASRRLIRHNDPDRLEVTSGISKELVPERRRADAPPVRQRSFATGSEEADWIAAEIGARIAGGARPRDHAVLLRTNVEADAILRSLNLAGIPWRFSGASGLYSRPEVRRLLSFLRVLGDLGSTVDLYAVASVPPYDLGGTDLTLVMNRARRSHRALWEVLEELDRQPRILRLAPETTAGISRLVGDLRRYSTLAHERSAGEVLYLFLRESGLLAGLARADTVAAAEQLQNIARFFEIVRSQSALLADDRAALLAPHLRTLIEAGDDPATAELDPDADAVAVLTVHKAKGLEFPVVFLAGLVAGRFPTANRREPLSLPDALLHGIPPVGDHHLEEERRLFYVAMTRARDELILTHAADYGGARTRRVSQFVVEALDLPTGSVGQSAGTRSRDALERLSTFAQRPDNPPAEVERAGGPLSLSFYQVDDYLACPLKYRYVHVLGIPTAPHHSLVYGKALHQAVQEFHRRQARGEVMTEDELDAAFVDAWTNEGFLTREHEAARLAAGKAALRRFRDDQLRPGTVVPAYVEREFAFTIDGDRVRGRWDRVDIEVADPTTTDGAAADSPLSTPALREGAADVVSPSLPLMPPERVTITDYKSSDVRDPVRANERARDSLQLSIYALGYEAISGRLPDAVQLYFLESGLIGRAPVDQRRLDRARSDIRQAATGIRAADWTARPDFTTCTYCAVRDICPVSAAR